MLTELFLLFADDTAPATTPAGKEVAPSGPLEQFYPFLLPLGIGVVFYVMFWRPMQREKKQREALLNQIKKNDDVLLTSGIYGSVVGVAEDKDEITVKIADNTRIRVVKSAIARNMTNEETLKAQQAAGKATTPPKTEGNA